MIDYELIKKHFNTARAAVESEKIFTLGEIQSHLLGLKKFFKMNDETFEELNNQILKYVSVSLDSGHILTKNDNANWFVDSRSERGQKRFTAYEQYLENVANLSSKVITGISLSMDKVMNNIGDPKREDSYLKKGLVIGDVQSGKTGNFIALMNKAADAGYNMVVITTGTIEKLRRQTQSRIEEGFIGTFTATRNKLSKSKTVKDFGNSEQTLALTNADKDFSIRTANPVGFGSAPIVAVIKKNKRSLEDLYKWLENNNEPDIKRTGKIDRSLLFIDDEADNATINTRGVDDPTTINKGIRNILGLFKRSSYVGFTATPFANVLIDHNEEDDLFPTDFIQVLDTPTNYMGANLIFPEEGKYHSILKNNDDAEKNIPIVIPKEQNGTFIVEELPESLKEAIRLFFIQNAIRDLRGDTEKHRSMLVNVSHRAYIQEQVNDLITDEVGVIKRQIKLYINQTDSSIHQSLKELCQKEFPNIKESWEDIYKTLYRSTDAIINEVINANNKSFQYEDYPNGARIIAVGGFALSRGLTLEGLSVSYLYRNTLMYDTLMQMGRWFGYRPNYDDIIKLYMPERSIDWYFQILEATNDLKRQLKSMINEHKSPKDFGLYILDPNNQDEATLLVTARNKMRNALTKDVTIRISGDFKETTKLKAEDAKTNRNFVENWIEENNNLFDDGLLATSVSKEIARGLLTNYNYGSYNKLNSMVVNEVLKEFDKFDIQIAGNSGSKLGNIISRVRTIKYESTFGVICFSNSRLGSPSDGKFGLNKEQLEKVKKLNFNQQKQYFSEFTKDERNPLIVLYPIELRGKPDGSSIEFVKEHSDEVFWAVSLGVPMTGKKTLVYQTKMNTVLQQQLIEGAKIDLFVETDEIEEDIE